MQTNVLHYGDNLDIDIPRRYLPDAPADLAYLDPPLNSNREYNVIFRDESGNATEAEISAAPAAKTPAARARAFALLTIVVLVGACSAAHRPAAAPTLAETRAFITKMVQLAQAGDFVQLCEMGGGNCQRILESAGADNVPADPPTVARIYEVPSIKYADGSWSQGGQMVEMCGTDGRGAAYETQMLVFRDQTDHVIAIEPIYWSGLHINVESGQPVGPATQPAFAC